MRWGGGGRGRGGCGVALNVVVAPLENGGLEQSHSAGLWEGEGERVEVVVVVVVNVMFLMCQPQ